MSRKLAKKFARLAAATGQSFKGTVERALMLGAGEAKRVHANNCFMAGYYKATGAPWELPFPGRRIELSTVASKQDYINWIKREIEGMEK